MSDKFSKFVANDRDRLEDYKKQSQIAGQEARNEAKALCDYIRKETSTHHDLSIIEKDGSSINSYGIVAYYTFKKGWIFSEKGWIYQTYIHYDMSNKRFVFDQILVDGLSQYDSILKQIATQYRRAADAAVKFKSESDFLSYMHGD